MIELAILGLLKEGPQHGYELRRRLSDLGLLSVSFGSLYPALRRLHRNHSIEVEAVRGRRKVYQITSLGETRFQQLIERETADQQEDERSFRTRMAFLRFLDPEQRLGLLETRRGVLADRAKRARGSLRKAKARTRERLDRYTLSLLQHRAEAMEADIAWLDGLIAAERAALPGWPDTAPAAG